MHCSKIRRDLWAESYTQEQLWRYRGGVTDIEHVAIGTWILLLILHNANITNRVRLHVFCNQIMGLGLSSQDFLIIEIQRQSLKGTSLYLAIETKVPCKVLIQVGRIYHTGIRKLDRKCSNDYFKCLWVRQQINRAKELQSLKPFAFWARLPFPETHS